MVQLLLGYYIHRYVEACVVSCATARMQLHMMAEIQAQRTPFVMIHRGVGARQVKVKLSETRKINLTQTPDCTAVY